MYSDCRTTFVNIPSTIDGRLTAPALEPISVDDLSDHARIDIPDEDLLLQGYIASAREWVENETNVSLGSRTVMLKLDAFPTDGFPIEIRFPPLSSVTSITYVDSSGSNQTWDSASYRVSTTSRPGRIEPVYGQIYPFTYPVIDAVTVTAVVGYSTPASVPQCAKQAIRFLAALYFQKREPTTEDLTAVRRVLDPLRWEGRP